MRNEVGVSVGEGKGRGRGRVRVEVRWRNKYGSNISFSDHLQS